MKIRCLYNVGIFKKFPHLLQNINRWVCPVTHRCYFLIGVPKDFIGVKSERIGVACTSYRRVTAVVSAVLLCPPAWLDSPSLPENKAEVLSLQQVRVLFVSLVVCLGFLVYMEQQNNLLG